MKKDKEEEGKRQRRMDRWLETGGKTGRNTNRQK